MIILDTLRNTTKCAKGTPAFRRGEDFKTLRSLLVSRSIATPRSALLSLLHRMSM